MPKISAGFRRYFENTAITLPNGKVLTCHVSALYGEASLFVVVEPAVSLHGAWVRRQRRVVMEHAITLLRVPSKKRYLLTYIERYTHIPGERWLLVDGTSSLSCAESLASLELRQQLETGLLELR